MTRSEEKAREYEDSLDYYHYTSDNPSVAYKAGYEQAEKDLALSWEDVKQIEDLCMEVTTLFASVGRNKVILEPPFYEEVLKRFNKERNGRSNL